MLRVSSTVELAANRQLDWNSPPKFTHWLESLPMAALLPKLTTGAYCEASWINVHVRFGQH